MALTSSQGGSRKSRTCLCAHFTSEASPSFARYGCYCSARVSIESILNGTTKPRDQAASVAEGRSRN
ncbi:hypothetical protein LY78DRAFT_657662 [Colletotrichum sublineola]|nr:hypothetical protein LY78DRAFT_657662 [Colletotrichum sublineola]